METSNCLGGPLTKEIYDKETHANYINSQTTNVVREPLTNFAQCLLTVQYIGRYDMLIREGDTASL